MLPGILKLCRFLHQLVLRGLHYPNLYIKSLAVMTRGGLVLPPTGNNASQTVYGQNKHTIGQHRWSNHACRTLGMLAASEHVSPRA